jgi:hypothetical protein
MKCKADIYSYRHYVSYAGCILQSEELKWYNARMKPDLDLEALFAVKVV